ncbi:hypothetical protein BC937DRAFT_94218 [Endogone sp. FLAS-F59071]|nr:hypothetical protein BC937DRAFT_94218 [Endogone sp. FLAS-F59071]|eukprot:RUS14188.1 hypothetical protein BC937DRAFT_94218 [Endogone sp. FLAS-F59071]
MKRKQAPSIDSPPSPVDDDPTRQIEQNENEPATSAPPSKKPRKKPETKRKPAAWTGELDGVLMTVKTSEKFSWKNIVTFFPGRDITSCKNRWNRLQKLPEAQRAAQETLTTSWTPVHDMVLVGAKDKGMSWDEIAGLLIGKNVVSCKNRWNRMKKKERDAGDADVGDADED